MSDVIKLVSDCNISLNRSNFIYTSHECKPEVIIYDTDEELLKENEDYTLEYQDNINAGTAKIIITGIGDFSGTKEINFSIDKLSIENCKIECGEPDSNGCYNINNISVSIGDLNLVKDIDYELETKQLIEDGSTYINATVIGKGNYVNSNTKSFLASITIDSRINIVTTDITITPDSFTYNGLAHITNITIKKDNVNLKENEDYTLEYQDNINAGTAKIIIKGINDYIGQKTVEFTIYPYDISEQGSLSCGAAPEGYYDINNITVSANNKILAKNKDYSYTIEDIHDSNYNYTVITVTGIGNYTGSLTNKFRVSKYTIPLDLSYFEIDTTEFTYNEENQRPKILSSDLVIDLDYKLVYPEESSEIGNYKLKIIGLNKYSGTLEIIYSIIKVNIKDIEISFGNPDDEECYDINNLKLTYQGKVLRYIIDYNYTIDSETQYQDIYTMTEITITCTGNYEGHMTKSIITSRKNSFPGKEITFDNVKLYPRYSVAKTDMIISGTYYLWDGKEVNGRVRVTDSKSSVGQPGEITGWVTVEDITIKKTFAVGDKVIVDGEMNTYIDGTGNKIIKHNAEMYIVDIIDDKQYEYRYGLASATNMKRQGWAKENMIELVTTK